MNHKVLEYYKTCAQTAWRDTLAFFDLRTLRAWLHLLVPAIIAAIIKWQFFGWLKVSDEWIEWAVGIGGATLIWAILTFVYHLVQVAPKTDQARQIQISSLTSDLQAIKDSLIPRIRIDFEDAGPYVQSEIGGVLYRVGIFNTSPSRSLHDVSVRLEHTEPYYPPYLPLPLHLMHDNPPEGQRCIESFSLAPRETRFVDVISISKLHATPQKFLFDLRHTVNNLLAGTTQPIRKLVVSARATDCPATFRSFVIVPDQQTLVLRSEE